MWKTYGAIGIAALAGASVPVFAKVALEVTPPFSLVFLRFLFATLTMLPFVWKSRELSASHLKRLWWVGLIGALNPIFLFVALQFTQASVAPLIYAISPALTALIMYFWLDQKIHGKQLLGVIIGFIGVGLIMLLPAMGTEWDLMALMGNGLIFLAAIAFVMYGITSKRAMSQSMSAVGLTFYFCLMTLLATIPFVIWESTVDSSYWGLMSWQHWLSAVQVGVIGTSLFYFSYQYALARSSAVVASLFTYIQPVLTVIMAYFLIGETISALFVLGAGLALVGANLASKK